MHDVLINNCCDKLTKTKRDCEVPVMATNVLSNVSYAL